MDLIATNKLRYQKRVAPGIGPKGTERLYRKMVLQQWWANPFVDKNNGDGAWVDVPVTGTWNEPEEKTS